MHILKNRILLCVAAGLCVISTWSLSSLASDAAEPGPLFIGRIDSSISGQQRFGWPGSAIVFHFTGTRLEVRLDDNGQNSFVLDVDGHISRLNLNPGSHSYTLAENLAPGEHRVEIVRRTEGFAGPTVFAGATTDGHFLKTEPSARQIMLIGDSITAGYGIEGADVKCHYSPDTQNQYLTYGAVAGRYFGADVRTLAESGRGLVQNYDKSTTDTMRDLMDRTIPREEGKASDAGYSPDVIVVHLGTNDFSDGKRSDAFAPAYVKLLADLRAKYPKAMLYGAIGPMLVGADLEAAEGAIKGAVAKRKEAGDEHVGYIYFTGESGGAELGCDWHPNVAGHARMAQELIGRLKKDLGWSAAP